MALRDQDALDYHSEGRPGKTEVVPTKPCLTARDLSLAYTPGVAIPCKAIEANPTDAYKYTNKGNLVAVVSNGTAVLGLGNIGALAGKPVMEGKGILFKRFGHVDVFDIEIDTEDVDEIVKFCQLLEPTVGGINLEDIKAPECFEVEKKLRETMNIPVFHDDQHGTAIIAAAGLINAAKLQGKDITKMKVVVSGAGAAAIACAKLMETLGVPRENFLLADSKGVCYKGRAEGMNEYKEHFANETDKRTLAEAMKGADMFLGCSVAGLVNKDMVKSMADKPIVFAMANPDPEITYEDAVEARSDVIMATGRSDYPNQVNNVLGFPFIFRGALDIKAKAINEEMKIAAAYAIAELARQPVTAEVAAAYGGEQFEFGPEYIIPKPFDSRVLATVASAVAKAGCDSGVAADPITNWDAYRETLEGMTNKSLMVMHSIRSKAKAHPRKIVFSEGCNDRVLEACRISVDEGYCQPILLGNEENIRAKAEEIGFDLKGVTLKDPTSCPNLDVMAQTLFKERARKGYNYRKAWMMVQRPIHHGVMMLRSGEADGMVCGATRSYVDTLRWVLTLAEMRKGVSQVVGVHVLLVEHKVYIFADTTVNFNPDSRLLAEIALMAAAVARHFNLDPRVAMLSFSNFGDNDTPESRKVREAVRILNEEHPELNVDGEMHADVAVLSGECQRAVPDCKVMGQANVLIFPDMQSGNIAFKLVGYLGDREVIGPLLIGLKQPINVVSTQSTVAEIVNMAALSAYEVGRA
ncbi:MAG: NADP-dependent malic enzyme [Candidatus Krumholzibacteria bacterium]|nr:NADP-dependent malic enzyme [Candidatus Krumholzibacteria bacterium]